MNDRSKRLWGLLGLIATAAIVAAVIVCVIVIRNNTDLPIEDAATKYQAAVSSLNTDCISYTVERSTVITVGDETFRENASAIVTWQNAGNEHFICSISETLQVGSHRVEITEFYTSGKGYTTVNNSHFICDITADEYLQRLVPAVPITPSLYQNISGTVRGGVSSIVFTQASSTEPWLEDVTILPDDATVTVWIERENIISKFIYEVAYSYNDRNIQHTITVEIKDHTPAPISVPDNTSQYTQIADLDIPRYLEIACGHLLETSTLTALYTDSILCEAFGDLRQQSITISAVNGNNWNSRIDTKITLTNSSKTDSSTNLQKTELFLDGIYSASTDKSSFVRDDTIDEAIAKSNCQDILVGTIMLPSHISGATITETETEIRINFIANEEFAQLLSNEACTTLYRDGQILTLLAQNYETSTATCYLTIDKSTMLPLTSGFSYAGTYTIEGFPYRLEFSADQQYRLLNDNASEILNNNAGA